MNAVEVGPLRVRKIVKGGDKSSARPPLTVVLMHGFGAPGDDLVALAGAIEAPAGTTFLFPEAPTPLAELMPYAVYGDARAWWPIDVGRFERAMRTGTLNAIVDEIPEGIEPVRDAVGAMLDALERDANVPGDRIVLGGFSQGSMLALDVALRSSRPLAGLVVLSGTLLAAKEWVPRMALRKGLPVFQSHGTEDPVLPYAVAEQLRRALDDAGLRVGFTSFEGGHGIPPSVLRDLGVWLRQIA